SSSESIPRLSKSPRPSQGFGSAKISLKIRLWRAHHDRFRQSEDQPRKSGYIDFEPSCLERFGSTAQSYCPRADDNILRPSSSDLGARLGSVVEPYSIGSLASCFHACRIA